MVNDPYKVLGVSQSATQDEIKSAYRRMAKKYHPDLHPDDPEAANKMNEINEAYDMLSHPEKYAAKRAREQQSSGYGGYYGNPYGQRTSNSSQGGYQGAGGWYSDFGGFDFEDLFGFGRYAGGFSQMNINPTVQPGDSSAVASAINSINSGMYQEAFRILMNIEHAYRDARWYYLNAITLYGYGDVSQAADYMQKAVMMDQSNQTYRDLYQRFRQEGATYNRNTTIVFSPFRSLGKIFLFIIVIRIFFRFFFMLLGGFGPIF